MDLKKLLSEKLGEDELGRRLEKVKEEYAHLISDEGALTIIAKDEGIIGQKEMQPKRIKGKIVRLFELHEFERDGRKGKVQRVAIRLDENVGQTSGTEIVVLWNEQTEVVKNAAPGDVVEISSFYMKDGEIRIPSTAEVLLKKGGMLRVADLTDQRSVNIRAMIKKVGEMRKFDRNGEHTVANFIIEDETGSIPMVVWDKPIAAELRFGDIIVVENGYMKNGELHVGKGEIRVEKKADAADKEGESADAC
ncbi:MAG: hypothetical protein QXP42_01400 [Candidatus Micrarchaeia archaeon]